MICRYKIDSKLIIIAGDPGLGKSQVSLFICATVTTGGIWPVAGETCEKGNVLILSAEDGADDTIVPRLKALNAEIERIHIVQVWSTPGEQRQMDWKVWLLFTMTERYCPVVCKYK